jgi:hypothetical protein
MNSNQEKIEKTKPGKPGGETPGNSGEEHGNNLANVMIDQVAKAIHRGSYLLPDLKVALGVASGRDLDIIENGSIRSLAAGERITIKDGMEFISRQPAGGAS